MFYRKLIPPTGYVPVFLIMFICLMTLIIMTVRDLKPITRTFRDIIQSHTSHIILDRHGSPLTLTYTERWNTLTYVSLEQIPDFLTTAFVLSEDRHFYDHHGVDFTALLSALYQNSLSLGRHRGASTISEQVVRIINQRPRTLWSKWLELIEAIDLERHTTKNDLLEFYFNEVPYAANRRGIVEAAHYYFDRDLSTLTKKEALALVVLAQAPSAFDLNRPHHRFDKKLKYLADQLLKQQLLTSSDWLALQNETLSLQVPQTSSPAQHFVEFVKLSAHDDEPDHPLRTTLDSQLQTKTEELLSERLRGLQSLHVHNAAAIVIDHRTAEIRAWVVVGGTDQATRGLATNAIDAIEVPRQPGSSLKPFLYARALDQGWTAATLIHDGPIAETIRSGLHEFKNYSHSFYGDVTLREALGNSLNIPAIKTVQYLGYRTYLDTLHHLGMDELSEEADYYKDGLALGAGEVSLFEMAQAYTALAHHGEFRTLRFRYADDSPRYAEQVFTPEAASLIGNILSDPYARQREFGYNSVLNMPIATAVKTGTSTDYHDAWAFGYDDHHVIGIWMGNLDQEPMDGVTGVMGPALVLRSLFAELHRTEDSDPLFLSPNLIKKDICINPQELKCIQRTEYFIPGHELALVSKNTAITLSRPSNGLILAYDPRIPTLYQRFSFRIDGMQTKCGQLCHVRWRLNDQVIATTSSNVYPWPVSRGTYRLSADVSQGDTILFHSEPVHFSVK